MSKSTEALKQAHDKLQDAVVEIVSGEDWQRMLKVASKFHKYSFNNNLMVFCQRPDATIVAGFNKWKSMNRSVKKGEKGIAIFAPCKYKVPSENGPSAASPDGKGKVKDHNGTTASGSALAVKVAAEPNGEDRPKTVLHGFRIVHVFDISQTDGDPIEDLDAIRPKLLDGDAPEGIWDALVTQADAAGFEVVRDQKRNENGYCDFLGKRIAVRPDVTPAQAVKTLVHELGHALLHGDEVGRSREIQEVEVESVAYIVCDALGLDTGDYSFAYVARWSDGTPDLVKDTAERVVRCAKEILTALEDSPVQASAQSA
jgi:hypothetical protein